MIEPRYPLIKSRRKTLAYSILRAFPSIREPKKKSHKKSIHYSVTVNTDWEMVWSLRVCTKKVTFNPGRPLISKLTANEFQNKIQTTLGKFRDYYLVHVIKTTKFPNSESQIFCLLAWSTIGRDTLQFIFWNHATFSNSF